ncbi:MAG: hypothetical protein M1828_002426 [Chrysothrix sp. TS-e1954]|nr:MAG: hypothetical protein M1828_002426 [Chrysothrix sp. TS-e1954]
MRQASPLPTKHGNPGFDLEDLYQQSIVMATMAELPKLTPAELNDSRAPELLAIQITCLVLMFTPFGVGEAVGTFLGVKGGSGRHIQALEPSQIQLYYKGIKVAEYTYPLIIGLSKISVLLFFWRIFGVRREFRIFFWTLSVLVTLWTLGVIITICVECEPYAAYWNRALGTCISTSRFYTALTIPNIITDAFIWVLPMPFLLHLDISWGKKLGLAFAFGLGSVVMIVSGLRLWTLYRHQNSIDITFDFTAVDIFSIVEPDCAFICCCLPCTFALFRIAYLKLTGKPIPQYQNTERSTLHDRFSKANFQNWGRRAEIGGSGVGKFTFLRLEDGRGSGVEGPRTEQQVEGLERGNELEEVRVEREVEVMREQRVG